MGEKHCLTFAISEVVLKVPLYFFLLSRFLQQYHIWVFRLKKNIFRFKYLQCACSCRICYVIDR